MIQTFWHRAGINFKVRVVGYSAMKILPLLLSNPLRFNFFTNLNLHYKSDQWYDCQPPSSLKKTLLH